MYDLFFFRYLSPEGKNDVKALFELRLMNYSKEFVNNPDNVEAQAGKVYYEGLLKRISFGEKAEK